ncbi:ChaB family protein [candidate division WWE3 bacterium]|uniref:ChaB family protein n=1 Tax=candidate division WWE3 bacterium TaxID=2053526 RepID=A0A955LV82_UNCKA|nr:ChaB family protein [candidate division WWE3 bacterium]
MSYKNNSDLPESVRNNLPDHAQDIYREAYNSAHEEYSDPSDRKKNESLEETASKVAWSAVKNKYEKNNDTWNKK